MKHLMKRAWTKYALVALVTALVVAPAVAVASHGFTDVPDSHLFHNNIQWMKDNGVTLGCNPPANDKYCPSNTVNRGQMAAFMQRLAENKVVDAATAVTAETAADADKLDGLDSTELLTPLYADEHDWAVSGDLAVPLSTPTKLTEVAFTAEASGYVLINAHADFYFGTATRGVIFVQIDNTTCGDQLSAEGRSWFAGDSTTANRYGGGSSTVVNTVSAGAHTVTLCATALDAAMTNIEGQLTVAFSVSGAAPAAVSSVATGSPGE